MDHRAKQAGLWQVSIRVFKLVWEGAAGLFVLFTALEVVNALAPYVSLWIGKLIIDHLTKVGNGSLSLSAALLDSTLLRICILFFLVQVATRLISSFDTLFTPVLIDRVNGEAVLLLLQKISSFGELSIFDQPSFYDVLRNAEQGIANRPARMMQDYLLILAGSVGLASFFVILAQIHITLPFLIIAIMILLTRFQFQFWKQNWSIFWQNTEDTRKMDYYKSMLTKPAYAKEVRLFNLFDYILQHWASIFNDIYRRVQAARVNASRPILWLSLCSGVIYGAAFVYAVWMATSGRVTLGDLAIYVGAIIQAEWIFRPIIGGIGSLYDDGLYMSNLFSFLDLEPVLKTETTTFRLGKSSSYAIHPAPPRDNASSESWEPLYKAGGKQIEVRGLTLSYPGTGRKVLNDVSFTIQPGETVAIVGENGAGKTTLVKLLLRFYNPDHGAIRWGTTNIQEIPVREWRQQISAVFQDFASYALNAQMNIGLGDLGSLDDMGKIRLAAQKAGIHDLIEQLPEQYATPLSKRFTGGVDLSGGEWHKIALARAFVRESTSNLLILDEPMAALDARTEYELYKHFRELTKNKTTLLISHRFSNVRLADLILVLDQGRLVEQGTHQELVSLGGIYANLYALQVEQYFGSPNDSCSHL